MLPRRGFLLCAFLPLVVFGCDTLPTSPPIALDDDDDDVFGNDDDVLGDDDDATGLVPAEEGSLSTTNSVGRSGAYYIPTREIGAALPVMLAYHFSGGEGADMINTFRTLAEERGFAIVAPDSRVSPDGQFAWEVGNQPGEVTPDVTHALACLDELTGSLEVALDPAYLLAAGHSGGASSAPYIATNNMPFTAFAVLHGGVVAGGIGDRLLPGWLSTGEDDEIRPPEGVEEAAAYLQSLGFTDLTVTFFPGGHWIEGDESAGLIDWWLGP